VAVRSHGAHERHVVHGKFDEATWALFSHIGIAASYMRERSRGMVAVQQLITYKKELVAGDVVFVRSWIVEVRAKVLLPVRTVRRRPWVASVIEGKTCAVVNAATFDVPAAMENVPTRSLEGEPVEQRLARRKRSWIATVEIVFEGE
jgi:acyl-CoA thioesterase FadM